MGLLSRLSWVVLRRRGLSNQNSHAHWSTYVCPTSKLEGGNRLYPGSHVNKSSIGRNSYIAGAKVCNATIGAFCSIGPEVVIGGLGAHPVHWLSTHPAFYSARRQSGITFARENLFEELRPVTIGSDVWIGARALVLDGVSIGDGAIIAAGAVVAADVPPFAVVGGVPARVIRYRFSADVIEALLGLKWWKLEDEQLRGVSYRFTRTDWAVEDIVALQEELRR